MINEFGDERKCIHVTNGPLVDWLVILYGAKFSVLFLDVKETGFVWTFGWLNRSPFCVFFHELAKLFLFGLG
jgi:hypothetical protein